jgi:aminoglycoside 6-adenylyltransferase
VRKEDEILQQLQDWATNQEQIRAMVMTSSRANPRAHTDLFSDYDIELFVQDLQPFAESDQWLEAFGEILVRWPRKPTSFDEGGITRLVIFDDGLRIDFQLDTTHALAEFMAPTLDIGYDNGYKILLDKDNRLQNATAPTHTGYVLRKPTQKEFDELLDEFWWDITYVAKSLWRDELVFAKYMLDSLIRFSYFEKMVEWTIGVRTDWTANPNKHGRWFKRYLDSQTWTDLEATFAGAGIEDNWTALFNMIDLFRRLTKEVGNSLNYRYPSDLDRRVTAYLTKIRNLAADAEDFL